MDKEDELGPNESAENFSGFDPQAEQAQMLMEQYERRERRFWKTGEWGVIS